MKYTVWTTGAEKKGPYYPRVVEADSFEDAVEVYCSKRTVPVEGQFVVAQVGEVVDVTRRKKYEYETIVTPHEVN